MVTYAFIDASNMFYGGRKSLGWSMDLEKVESEIQKTAPIEDAVQV